MLDASTRRHTTIELPKTRADLARLIIELFGRHPLERVEFRAGHPIHVTWHGPEDASLVGLDVLQVDEEQVLDVIARIDLEELDIPEEQHSIWRLFGDASTRVVLSGHVPSHLLVHSVRALRGLFGVPSVLPIPKFPGEPEYLHWAGLRVVCTASIQEGEFVLLGAPVASPHLRDVSYGVRVPI